MRQVRAGLKCFVVLVAFLFLDAASCPQPTPGPPRTPLGGFVDLHTHPVSNVAFGGKLVYGGVSIGALLPADPDCNKGVMAATEAQALGHDRSTHGGYDLFTNGCGDIGREAIIHALQSKLHASDPPADAFGFPTFQDWPVWNDMTHQKMWSTWLKRSFDGGLRVMVALATNNKTLGDLVSGPGDLATDDKTSADLQIAEIEKFVMANAGFMEIALTAADVDRIGRIPKLAVVIGVEIDHIGNLQAATWVGPNRLMTVPSADEIKAEIHRLYDSHVRYIFPIHLLDNAFGGTAAYEDIFNASNFRESGAPWVLKCTTAADAIDYSYKSGDPLLALAILKLGQAFFPGAGPVCPVGPDGVMLLGQRNSLGLSANGNEGIKEMMRLGMLIDVDHMSQDSVTRTLQLAENIPLGGYPLFSGHNNVRGGAPAGKNSERALTAAQYLRIGALHGMAGVGSDGTDAMAWLTTYNTVTTAMGPGAVAAFGTDTNGFAKGMPPRQGAQMQTTVTPDPANAPCKAECPCEETPRGKPSAGCASCKTKCDTMHPGTTQTVCLARCDQPAPAVAYTAAFPASMDGTKTWNYNADGVAHYGMLPDFLMDVAALPSGAAVVANVNSGAEYFYQTWKKAETQKVNVLCDYPLSNCGGGTCTNVVSDSANCNTCGNACGAGMTCVNRVCECAPGTFSCAGACIKSDDKNCGGCGKACALNHVCTAGKCVLDL